MKLIIKGELCDFNTFQNKTRSNKFAGSKIKKEETEKVYWECKQQKLTPAKDYPVCITFNWYIKNNRKDLDNIAFSKKFILDGLVIAKVLEDDSQKFVCSFTDQFFTDKENPRIEVIL